MFYTSLKHLEGLTSPWKGAGCTDAGVEDLQDWVDNYPESVGQVGLYVVDQLSSINSGALDANIKTLAETLRKTNKPILHAHRLRVRRRVECIRARGVCSRVAPNRRHFPGQEGWRGV